MDRKTILDYLDKVSFVYSLPDLGQLERIKKLIEYPLFYELSEFEPCNKLILLSSECYNNKTCNDTSNSLSNCIRFMDSGGASLYTKDKFINPVHVAKNQIKFQSHIRFILDVIPYDTFDDSDRARTNSKKISSKERFTRCLKETCRNIEIMIDYFDNNKDSDCDYIIYNIIHGTNINEKTEWFNKVNDVYQSNFYAMPTNFIPSPHDTKNLKNFLNDIIVTKTKFDIDNIHLFGIGSPVLIMLRPILKQLFKIVTFDSLSWYKLSTKSASMYVFLTKNFSYGRKYVQDKSKITITNIPKFCLCPYCNNYNKYHNTKKIDKNVTTSGIHGCYISMHNSIVFVQYQLLSECLFEYSNYDIKYYLDYVDNILGWNLKKLFPLLKKDSSSLLDY